jgi:heptosyltransferase-2
MFDPSMIMRSGKKQNVQNVLIVSNPRAYIGDELLRTPFYRAIRRTFPNALITLAVGGPAYQVMQNNSSIDCFIPLEGFLSEKSHKKLIRYYDLVINVSPSKLGALVVYLAHAPYKICLGSLLRNAKIVHSHQYIYNVRLTLRQPSRSFLDYYLDYAKKIGLKVDGRQTEMFLTAAEREKADEYLGRLKLPMEKPIVVINPLGSRSKFLWGRDCFGQLADMLMLEKNAFILFVGTLSERFTLKRMTRKLKNNAYAMISLRAIREVAALISKCNLFIGNDRGLLHVALALRVPTIGIFGPYDPHYWFPYTSRQGCAVSARLSCQPCEKREKQGNELLCTQVRCFKALRVADVFRRAARYLA